MRHSAFIRNLSAIGTEIQPEDLLFGDVVMMSRGALVPAVDPYGVYLGRTAHHPDTRMCAEIFVWSLVEWGRYQSDQLKTKPMSIFLMYTNVANEDGSYIEKDVTYRWFGTYHAPKLPVEAVLR